MRPRRLLPLLVVLLALPPAAADARKLTVGVVANTIGYGQHVGAKQDEVLHTGARWIREELWPSQDRAQQDRLFRAAAMRGMRVLPLVSPEENLMPADPSAYAAWTAHLAARFGPGGSFWREHPELDGKLAPSHFEIWNEPYFPFSTGRVDPARYANLYVAAVQAGRAANPATRYLIAAETDVKTWEGKWVSWIDALFAARPDLGAHIDAATAHLYHRGDPAQPLGSYVHDKFRRIERLRERFAAHGVVTQFWITELGWSTCTAPDWCVTEDQQAARLATALRMAADWDFVDAVFLYHLRSWGSNPLDRELNFGILRADGTAKPAYVAFAEAVAAHAAPVYENAPQLALIGPWTLGQVRERALRAAPPNLRARTTTSSQPPRAASTSKATKRRVCKTVRRGGKRVRSCRTVTVRKAAPARRR